MYAPDVIDTLAGIRPGSRLDRIHARRPQARENAQASRIALFAPAVPGRFDLAERFANAAFVAGLHGQSTSRNFYAANSPATRAWRPSPRSRLRSRPARLRDPTAAIRLDRSAARTSQNPSTASPRPAGRRWRCACRRRSVADVVQGAAFFNWANWPMLTLGEPQAPAGR